MPVKKKTCIGRQLRLPSSSSTCSNIPLPSNYLGHEPAVSVNVADAERDAGSTTHRVSPSLTDNEDAAPTARHDAQEQGEQQFKPAESQKIGVTGAVFLILNKMIGTGSE